MGGWVGGEVGEEVAVQVVSCKTFYIKFKRQYDS